MFYLDQTWLESMIKYDKDDAREVIDFINAQLIEYPNELILYLWRARYHARLSRYQKAYQDYLYYLQYHLDHKEIVKELLLLSLNETDSLSRDTSISSSSLERLAIYQIIFLIKTNYFNNEDIVDIFDKISFSWYSLEIILQGLLKSPHSIELQVCQALFWLKKIKISFLEDDSDEDSRNESDSNNPEMVV